MTKQRPRFTSRSGPAKLKWVSTDNKESFLKNWDNPKTRKDLIRHGYNDPKCIRYNLDKYGFRLMPKVNDNPDSILTLGDSNTFGVGLPEQKVWPALLSELIEYNVFNAGEPGSSTDAAFRFARELIPEVKPVAVFHLVTYENRREIISDDMWCGHPYLFGPWNEWDMTKEELDLIDDYSKLESGKISTKLNAEKNRLAIAQICYLNNMHYIEILQDQTDEGQFEKSARDLMHGGFTFQNAIARQMYSKYQSITKKA
jgi:hypothetical protein